MDNYTLWLEHEADQQDQLVKFPICDKCGEHIQSEYRYRIDGDLLCEDCFQRLVKEEFREDNT